ncbi:MAG TPA: hypothetical protein VNH42_06310 [Mariprofundaceae bacterium]|nr:hypothetical protein [Mariprofundaceae bacterium]
MIRRNLPLGTLLIAGLATAWASLPPTPARATVAMQTPELAHIEGMAETAIDQFLHKDFKTAHRTLGRMQHAFDILHREISHKPYDERKERELATMHLWLREMGIAIDNRSGIGGAIAANQLTASLIRYQDFPDTVKSSIAWLDYLGREIVLLNMEGPRRNASLLEFQRNDLQVTWHTLRRLLLRDMRNKPVTLRVDDVVEHLTTRLDRNDQVQDGNKLLSLIDRMDRLPDPLAAASR